MSRSDLPVAAALAGTVLIVGLLWALGIALCREWVKRDLRTRGLRALHVRWSPVVDSDDLSCGFRVRFKDAAGVTYEGRCRTPWLRPAVTWRDVHPLYARDSDDSSTHSPSRP